MKNIVHVAGFTIEILIFMLLVDSLRILSFGVGWLVSVGLFFAYGFLLLAGKTPSMLISGIGLERHRTNWELFRFVIDSINACKFPQVRYTQSRVCRPWFLLVFGLALLFAVEFNGTVVLNAARHELIGKYTSKTLQSALSITQSSGGIRVLALDKPDSGNGVMEVVPGIEALRYFPFMSSFAVDGRLLRGWRPLTSVFVAIPFLHSP